MAAIATSGIVVPSLVANKIWAKTQQTSVLARLSQAEPQKFGQSSIMTLTGDVKAELVGEGAQKSPTNPTFGNVTVTPHKLQVTVRMSDEVKWADEDYMLDVWNTCAERGAGALGRALDIVGIHKINPLTGQVAQSVTRGIVDTTNSVTVGNSDSPTNGIETAVSLVIAGGYTPNAAAFDPTFAFSVARERSAVTGQLYNPNLGFGIDMTNYNGLNAAVSNTVSAVNEAATATGMYAIVGDFSAFRWGVQREIGASVIEYGDPDGLGDLQRQNQIALRMEIVYGIGIADLNAFAKVIEEK